MINNGKNLYFPCCKIINAVIVPKKNNVIFLNLKTVDNTPAHYPKHSLLNGKVEFTFGLDLTSQLKINQSKSYSDLFNSDISKGVSKLVGKSVSALILFNPESSKKLDTIGLGFVGKEIILFNDNWTPEDMAMISQEAKLNFDLLPKGRVKREKI